MRRVEDRPESSRLEDKLTEKDYLAWLCSIPGLYPVQRKSLLSCFGTAEALWRAPEGEFDLWERTGNQWIGRLISFRARVSPGEIRRDLGRKRILFCPRGDPAFPARLRNLSDCPPGIFYRGRLPDPDRPSAAVVGARRCSDYGRYMAERISGALTEAGFQIISGMALGIDGIAQKKALDLGGSSFGVLGCGVDLCYPMEHFPLYERLEAEGGLISEFPAGTPPMRGHFPMRNRIISGLSELVVVVEAREKSGSLITADLALEQGRDVYAVPGRATDPLSAGCNRLISQGACPVWSLENFLEEVLPEYRRKGEKEPGETVGDPPEPVRIRKVTDNDKGSARDNVKQLLLAPDEKLVYSNLDFVPLGLDTLAEAAGYPISLLPAVLLRLQLKGLIRESSKNHYVRLK